MLEALIGLLGVIVGAVVTATKEWWIAKISRRKDGEYLAIRVVCMLDCYVEACVDVVADDGMIDVNGHLAPQVSLPIFEVQSLDVNWKAISAKLMYEVLAFPNYILTANQRISAAWGDAIPPDWEDFFDERQYQYATLGLKAAMLAEQLRRHYQIPNREYGELSPVSFLTERKSKTDELREKRAEYHAVQLNSIQSK